MRTCSALLCALALIALPFFFGYLEADRLLGWPDAVYLWFDPCLPVLMILFSCVVTLALPCIAGLFVEPDHRDSL